MGPINTSVLKIRPCFAGISSDPWQQSLVVLDHVVDACGRLMLQPGQHGSPARTPNAAKYRVRNPVMRRIISRFVDSICRRVMVLKPARIVDLGCGEGQIAHAISQLPLSFDYLGLDMNERSVEEARRLTPGLRFECADILTRDPDVGSADMVICLEVLEHLADPQRALAQVMQWTCRDAIVSVPWEPYFRIGNFLRIRHLGRWGNHPEHIQHFNATSFKIMLEPFSPLVNVETCFPWLIGHLKSP